MVPYCHFAVNAAYVPVSTSIRQRLQVLEMQKEKLDAELSFLKAQINPHFLFNTLNSIYALSIRKSEDTPNAIIQLSELMRYIIKDSKGDTVPLDKEIPIGSSYERTVYEMFRK